MSEVSRTVRIVNRRGLHARASAKFVTLASSQPVEVRVGLIPVGRVVGRHQRAGRPDQVVGPRPGRPQFVSDLEQHLPYYAERHMVKPGITGWAQINGWRGETDTQEKIQRRVEHDLYYIENWSLSFDLKIILKTLGAVLRREGAY